MGYPVAVATMFAVPTANPVSCGWVAGVVAPAAMKTLAGKMAAVALALHAAHSDPSIAEDARAYLYRGAGRIDEARP